MELNQIRRIDIEYKILKHTSVMLMPRINKFKVTNLDDLIKALKIEKVWGRFKGDMKRNYDEISDQIEFEYDEFFTGILHLIDADFIHKGQESEEKVREWLTRKGWKINPYSDKTAYSEEARGIDIVCSKYNSTKPGMEYRYISVKSPGFWGYRTEDIVKQLTKMSKANAWLFVSGKDKFDAFAPERVKELKEQYAKTI